MSVYAMAVFLHIVGALGLFAALALEWASLYNLRRVPTAGQAREWTKLLSALRFVGGPSTLTILATGIYMMATRWAGRDGSAPAWPVSCLSPSWVARSAAAGPPPSLGPWPARQARSRRGCASNCTTRCWCSRRGSERPSAWA